MNHRFLSCILVGAILCTPLIACASAPASSTAPAEESISTASSIPAEPPASQEENGTVETASESVIQQPSAENISAEQDAESLNTAKKEFQHVFDEFQPSELYEGQYSGCTHYTIVNDYDGDGKLEAFGFIGLPSDSQPAPFWENLSIYYIDSEYHISPLLGNDSEYDTVNGSIRCPEPTASDDFSNCVYSSGTERFLAWNVAYWEGDWFGLIFSVHKGKPVVSYLSGIFYVTDNGQFATFDEDYKEILLQLRDGQMINA